MVELDGSYGEGGGALVRVALALSALTGEPLSVKNIRANRPEPGLKAQHLEAVKALKQICEAKTSDIALGSTEFWFHPGKIKKGTYEINIGTAGSITLALQALILPCLFASGKVTLKIKGGTCGKWQASVDYLQHLLLPHLQRFVEKIEMKILQRGYYPAGGGEIHLEISPRFKLKMSLKELQEEMKNKVSKIRLLERGELQLIKGIINSSKELEEKEVGERIKHVAEGSIKKYNVPINIEIEYAKSQSIGGEFLLWANFSSQEFDNRIILGSSVLIEKGKSSEQIGKEAAELLIKEIESDGAVDKHLADQLVPFMALLPESEIFVSEITEHTKTNIYVIEKFLPVKFEIEGRKIKVLEDKQINSRSTNPLHPKIF